MHAVTNSKFRCDKDSHSNSHRHKNGNNYTHNVSHIHHLLQTGIRPSNKSKHAQWFFPNASREFGCFLFDELPQTRDHVNGDIDGVEALDHRNVFLHTRENGRTLGFGVKPQFAVHGCSTLYPLRNPREAGIYRVLLFTTDTGKSNEKTHIFLNDLQ